ncbi:unnamed protein product, partial [Ectocarpus sp. 13 AM-2016]
PLPPQKVLHALAQHLSVPPRHLRQPWRVLCPGCLDPSFPLPVAPPLTLQSPFVPLRPCHLPPPPRRLPALHRWRHLQVPHHLFASREPRESRRPPHPESCWQDQHTAIPLPAPPRPSPSPLAP